MLILPNLLQHLFPGFKMLPGKLALMTMKVMLLFAVMTTVGVQFAFMWVGRLRKRSGKGIKKRKERF